MINDKRKSYKTNHLLIQLKRVIYWELKLELRSAGSLLSLLGYAATLAVLFHYSLLPSVFSEGQNLTGLLLLSLFFMVSMVTARGMNRERESGAFRILLLSGMDRSAFLIGRSLVKTFAIALMLVVYSILYNVLLVGRPDFFYFTWLTVLFLLPCSLNLVLLGEVISVMSNANRLSEIVLPLLFFPLSLPIFIVYSGSAAVIHGKADLGPYLTVIFALILLYAGIGSLFFQMMTTDET
ncbi:MAG: heme exporter protein CcmB [Leptonema sp. (in: Bacteria)]|nr:heme exporter protein CcmB [Leptonema sp. (in: bacteria)]